MEASVLSMSSKFKIQSSYCQEEHRDEGKRPALRGELLVPYVTSSHTLSDTCGNVCKYSDPPGIAGYKEVRSEAQAHQVGPYGSRHGGRDRR